MMQVAWLFALLVVVCISSKAEFEEFIVKYGRKYGTPEEYSLRYQNFMKSKAFVEMHNSDPERTYDVAVNKFSDLTPEELSSLYHSGAPSSACYTSSDVEDQEEAIPGNLDWRSTGNVVPVSNQGQCGAVSYVQVASQVASVLSISTNLKPIPVSAQQLIDCVSTGFDYGCNGGDPWDLYLSIEEHGIEAASSYPYKAKNEKCKFNSSKAIASIDSTNNVTGENALKVAVATYGPTIALFNAGTDGFIYYTSGIFSGDNCSTTSLDHVLLIVGYGVTNNGTAYWIAQNVFGTDWGMDGYILVERNKNVCGIATCSTYVTGAHVMP